MRRINIIVICIATLLVYTSCVKSYTPNIKAADLNKYVVMGQVNSNDSVQTVSISMTSSINEPEYIPVTGCSVEILDDQNHRFYLSDQGDGNYKGVVGSQFMVPGTSFKVAIQTPDGDSIVSDYDKMSAGPQIDSVFYSIRLIQATDAANNELGIQFYVDLKAKPTDSRYYRWNMTETWEYHSKWPIQWWYDGNLHHVYPPDSSRMVCWRTLNVPQVYTLSTTNLTQNEFSKFPLNFVSNKTVKLEYGYSLLIEQEAISEAAYQFWERMKLNNSTQGGLYEKQPLTVEGNLKDKTNGKQVLGFFSAVSAHSKRIFIKSVPGLPLDYQGICHMTILKFGLRQLMPFEYPVYLAGDRYSYSNVSLTSECVDCLLLGGSNVKPSFWPKNE